MKDVKNSHKTIIIITTIIITIIIIIIILVIISLRQGNTGLISSGG